MFKLRTAAAAVTKHNRERKWVTRWKGASFSHEIFL